MKEIEVLENDAGQRLDKFLMKTFPDLSKSMMYKRNSKKKIKVNRKRCTYDQMLQPHDHILLFLPPDVLKEKEREVPSASTQLDIVFEDQNLLIINKPAGLLSQSDQKEKQDCVVSRVQAYLYQKGEYTMADHSFAPTICHRLDRNTAGLIIAAKNANTLRIINQAIAERAIKKQYRALVSGTFLLDSFQMHGYLKKEGTKAIVKDKPTPGFAEAYMDVKTISKKKDATWCDILLHTGRFHQIRAMMGHFHHPLVGDHKYGYEGPEKQYSLIAYRLDLRNVPMEISQRIFEI